MVRIILIFGCLIILTGCFSQIFVPMEENVSSILLFCPRDNCERIFVAQLQSAQHSLHCALYDITLVSAVDIFERKFQSGIDVKVVVDGDNAKEIDNRSFVRVDTMSQYMHNKFCVVDGKIVMTGSMNPTIRDTTTNNNNFFVINSSFLSKNYEAEFNEIWNYRFGEGKKVLYPHLLLNGTMYHNYFCPEDDCEGVVVDLIDSSNVSVHFMTFSFTSEKIVNHLLLAQQRNVSVSGVFDYVQSKQKSSAIHLLSLHNVNVKSHKNAYGGFMHHKVFIIDKKIVVFGSYNPTDRGASVNDENILVVEDASLSRKFLDEFSTLS